MNVFPSTEYVYLFAIQLAFGLLDMLLVVRLYKRIYGKAVLSKIKLYAFALGLALVTAIGWRLVLPNFRPTSTPPLTVLSSLLLLPLYKGTNRRKKLLFSLLLFAVALFWLYAYDWVVSPMSNKIGWLIEAGEHLGFWLILEAVGYLGREKRQNIPASMWALFVSISAASIMVSFGMAANVLTREGDPYAYKIEFVIMLTFMFINIVLFILFDRFAAFVESNKERYLLEQQLQLQDKHYQELEQLHSEIRTIHHDMKNHLNTAVALAERGNQVALKEYLEETSSKIGNYEQTIITGNPEIDSILNMKITELKQSEIAVKTDIHIPPDLKITFDLAATIFGNLLDNVREACEEVLPKKRWAHIALAYINDSLIISIVNSASQKIDEWKDGLPVTNKPDKVSHGLGLKSVLQKVESIGVLSVKSEATSFSVEIVLYDV